MNAKYPKSSSCHLAILCSGLTKPLVVFQGSRQSAAQNCFRRLHSSVTTIQRACQSVVNARLDPEPSGEQSLWLLSQLTTLAGRVAFLALAIYYPKRWVFIAGAAWASLVLSDNLIRGSLNGTVHAFLTAT